MTPMPRRNGLILLLLSVVCASVNVTKAVHIDDAAYLEIAQTILADPLHPMQGELSWDYDTTAPISRVNQPHLFFYIQALVMAGFGDSPLAQHLLMAVISAAAIFAFYLLATLFVAPRLALVLSAIFALGPAFLPGQNLMVDVPLVALWLVFFWALCSAPGAQGRGRYWIAAAAMTAAPLVKYTSLALPIVFCVALVLRREWKWLWLLALPLSGLAAWSLFNYLDYGGVHLLSRRVQPFAIERVVGRTVAAVAGIGAVAPFSILFLSRRVMRRTGLWPLAAGAVAGVAMLFVARHHPKCPWPVAAFWGAFTGNGVFVLALACRSAAAAAARGWRRERTWQYAVLLLWLGGALGFTVLFSPFMAVRHILPAIPPLLLLLGHGFGRLASRRWAALAVVATALLGGGLALADYQYADVYRRYASKIAESLPPCNNVWFTGHWGWQWYAKRAGMRQYDRRRPGFGRGDYFVVPSLPGSAIAPQHRKPLKPVKTFVERGGPLTRLRTMTHTPGGGYYGYSFESRHLPWIFLAHPEPLETFQVLVVVAQSHP